MTIMTVREALRQALVEEMDRDENVILMGEEVAEYNGAYKVSAGLLDRFGPGRVLDTPISEEGFTGIGIGAAMAGLRPVVEWMTVNFSLQAIDQVYNNAAKMLYMSGGQLKIPVVFRGPNGPAEYLSAQHSQALQSIFCHCPGLKVMAPSNPYDAKGMLKTAIRDDNPVIFLESELMCGWKGEAPESEYLIPFGEADIKRSGSDVTLVSFSKTVKLLLDAADELSREQISAEVIDLRSLKPLDELTLYNSVKKPTVA
jgi:Pyruvate/2-oxoglutarate dehydrogenase complex, dehydrogenase (E1) component, eukaryotic type, beta subunit